MGDAEQLDGELSGEITVEDETHEDVRLEELLAERTGSMSQPRIRRPLARKPTIRRTRAPSPPPLAPALHLLRELKNAPERARQLFAQAQAEVLRGELAAAQLNLKLAISLDPTSSAYRAELASLDRRSIETGNAQPVALDPRRGDRSEVSS